MNVLCIGEILADVIVKPTSTVAYDNDCTLVDEIVIKTGGDSFNNSIDLTILGNKVYYVGRIGNDPIGDYLLKSGKDAGVNMDHVVYSDNPHAKMNILVNKSGDRTFFYYPGTSAELSFEDIDLSLLDTCKLVQVGGTFHLPKFDGTGAAQLFKEAKKRGVITSMDVTKDFSNRWNEIIEPCYPYLDYFLPSIEQAEFIAGTTRIEEIAYFFLSRGVKNILIKLGKKGCYFENDKTGFYCNSYSVPVVETTGAGDAFVSGFITGLLKNFSIEKCVQLGTACSASVIQAVGATTGMKNLESTIAYIEENPPLTFKYVK